MKRKFLQFGEISRHVDSILENFNKMESSCKFPRKIVKIVPFYKSLAFLASQTPRFRPVLTKTGFCQTRFHTCKFQCQVWNIENDSKILSQFLKFEFLHSIKTKVSNSVEISLFVYKYMKFVFFSSIDWNFRACEHSVEKFCLLHAPLLAFYCTPELRTQTKC